MGYMWSGFMDGADQGGLPDRDGGKATRILARILSSGLADDFSMKSWLGFTPDQFKGFFGNLFGGNPEFEDAVGANFSYPGFGTNTTPGVATRTQAGEDALARLFELSNVPNPTGSPGQRVTPTGGQGAVTPRTRNVFVGDPYGGGFGPGAGRGGVGQFDIRSLFGRGFGGGPGAGGRYPSATLIY